MGRHSANPRFLRDATITAKLLVMMGSFVVAICLFVAIAAAGLEMTEDVRAYVVAEGLWSKAQKNAVYYLRSYVHTGDPEEYRRYQQAIDVPLAAREARLEIDKPDFDYDRAAYWSLRGGNAPEAVPDLIYFYRWFHGIGHFAKAVEIWKQGDELIAELMQIAAELHERNTTDQLDPANRKRLMTRLRDLNDRLTALETRFSGTLQEGAEWTQRLVLWTLVIGALLLLGSGLAISGSVAYTIRRSILALRAGAARVGRGDLGHKVPVISRDELGQLAQEFNDMTARRREAKAALEHERGFLKAVLENLSEGVAACDAGGTLTFFNGALRRMHGKDEERLTPERWSGVYNLFDADGVTPVPTERLPLVQALRGAIVRDAELVIAPPGQPARTVLCSAQAIDAPDGSRLGAVVTVHDVTERKRAEKERERTRAELAAHAAELERSNHDLEQYAYVASHDLQAPLRNVVSFTQLLQKEFPEAFTGNASEYMDHIVQGGKHMQSLINGLLAFSRVGRQDAQMGIADCDLILANVKAQMDRQLTERGATITHDPLPKVYGSAHELNQLFQNLIDNGVKFRSKSPPHVAISAQRRDHAWEFTVADNGIGVAPEHASRIFQVFQRLHTAEQYPGTGIGLAICKKIVERHGGRIWLEPTQPGSTFRFTLPAAA